MPRPDCESTLNAGQVNVPLDQYLREVALEAARTALAEHKRDCPVGDLGKRVWQLELRFATLLGFMAGSGFLGGLAGGFLATLIQT